MLKRHEKILFAIVIFVVGIIVASLKEDYRSQGYSSIEAKNMIAHRFGFVLPIYLLCGLIYYLYWKIKLKK